MKRELINMLQCPECCGKLYLREDTEDVIENELKCTKCLTIYPVQDGIPNLLASSSSKDTNKQNEIKGWSDGFLDYNKTESTVPVEFLVKLPYINKMEAKTQGEHTYWYAAAECLNILYEELKLENSIILEIGAGAGWVSRRLTERGNKCTAVDIARINLMMANQIIKQTGVYFERIEADAEKLPFIDNIFDAVIGCASLHHFTNMPKLLKEARRVLKKNGYIYFMNEPLRRVTDDENELLKDNEEAKRGINEHIPSYMEYRKAFVKSHLKQYIFLKEFRKDENFRNWLKNEKKLMFKLAHYMLNNKILTRILELYWMNFMGGNIQLKGKK